MNKYLAAAVSGLSCAVASFAVTQSLGGRLGSVLLLGIGANGLVAWLAALGHAGRRERLGLPAETFGSIVIGWTVALLVDLVAGIAFVLLIVILLSRTPDAGF